LLYLEFRPFICDSLPVPAFAGLCFTLLLLLPEAPSRVPKGFTLLLQMGFALLTFAPLAFELVQFALRRHQVSVYLLQHRTVLCVLI
jgi:hypothetical protein